VLERERERDLIDLFGFCCCLMEEEEGEERKKAMGAF
jgi:hypothetical protein